MAGSCRLLVGVDRVLGVGELCAAAPVERFFRPRDADGAVWRACEVGLGCAAELDGSYCVDLPSAGEPIRFPSHGCARGSYERDLECVAWDFAAAGEACPVDPASPWGCGYDGECDSTTGRCRDRMPRDRGEVCAPGECREGLACRRDDTTWTCGDLLGGGDDCEVNAECASGLCVLPGGCCLR